MKLLRARLDPLTLRIHQLGEGAETEKERQLLNGNADELELQLSFLTRYNIMLMRHPVCVYPLFKGKYMEWYNCDM